MLKSFGPIADAKQLRVTEAVRKLTFYKDRKGYDSQFIDGLSALPLPGAGKWTDDLIELVDRVAGARGLLLLDRAPELDPAGHQLLDHAVELVEPVDVDPDGPDLRFRSPGRRSDVRSRPPFR